ncbi:CPK2 [Symbiodinium microadriaticum]|nr:CPK2 [Symbiodinium microadriaticum]
MVLCMRMLSSALLCLTACVMGKSTEGSCHAPGVESKCHSKVMDAMLAGFEKHPDDFPGLNTRSNYRDFQAFFWNNGMHSCPRPCMAQEEPCVPFDETYPASLHGGLGSGTSGTSRPAQRSARRQEPQRTLPLNRLAAGAAFLVCRRCKGPRFERASRLCRRAAMVAMHEATVRRAGEEILSNVDLEVPVGARAVVVGPNGCGKTTLLTTIAAQDPVEGGFLDVRASSVGWLRQEAIGGSKKTVYHEAVSQMPAMMAKMQMEAAQKALSEAKEADVLAKQQAYEEATSKFEAAGGRSMERKIEDVLTGLGFSSADFEKSCSELSGGWQMRVALARALLREPELLLLDEPTNHMDASAKNWLATYLAAGLPETSTLLLVTHDRSLLEEMHCSQVYEIAERRILRYDVSGIAEWEKSREQRVAKLQKEMLKIERTIAADEDYVRRFGAKSSHAAQAQARKKRIAKAEKELEDLRGQTRGLPSASVLSGKKGSEEDSDDDAQGLLPLSGPGKVKFNLPDWPLGASPPLDRKLLTLKETEIRYDGGEPVLNIEAGACTVFVDVFSRLRARIIFRHALASEIWLGRGKGPMLEFEVQCDTVPGEVVAICGSEPLSWDAKQALMLDPTDYPAWRGRVAAPQSDVEFKYLIVKRGEGVAGELVRWEGDFPNRTAHRENDVAKLVLRHRFGDVTFECKEVVHASGIPEKVLSKPGSGYAEVPVTPEAPPAVPALPISKRGEEEAQEPESVLGGIAVDPALRLARLVRSTSATAFSMKYDVKSTVLGTGMTGGVVVGTNKETGVEVAIKKLPLNSSMNPEHIKSEIQHQLTLDHPNICRLLEVYEEPDRLLMVMEKLDGPDLFDSLSKKSRYTEKDAREVVKQILSAVAYCHRNGVCHRDLKLENFCMEDKSEHARIKMIDFGLSSSFDDSLPMTDSCGTLYYVAPEVLRGKYNQQCDMWSLGVLTYILLDGRAPFMGRDDRRTYRLILEGQYVFPENRWGRISDDAKNFVSKLLKVDPEVRMTAEEALIHPWLTSKEPHTEAESAPPALDADVLDGLKALTRGNAAKRAVLRAMAPVASVDEVSRWADQFETFDAQGTGHVKVSDLVKRLVSRGLATAAEAQDISDGLKTVADSSQEISYSAFLTACLCAHHSRLEEKHLKEIFSKLDKDKDNHVSVEEVGKALGGVVNIEALESEMNGRALSFSDFQWLFQRPLAPSSMAGLRQLLGTFQNLGLTKSWRVDTAAAKAAKDGDDAQFVAARRENAAWRQWHRERTRAESPEDPPPPHRPSEEDGKDRLSPKKLLLETAPLPAPNSSRPPSRAPSSHGNLTPREIPTADLVEPSSLAKDARDRNDNGELKKEWAVATAEAKEFVVSAGQRLALLGPNGCGKTTLLRSLAGRLEVEAGCRILGAGGLRRARVAFFTQDLAQDLPGDITPVEHVLGDDAPISLDKEGARAALGALGLRGACHNAPIKTLSGGEKARVALAVFATRPADVLLLDEPTNHLDGAAVASLCAGLREHGGAVLVSSHDKAFLEALRVTDQVHIARAEVGEPGHLKVIHAPVARDFGAGGAAPSAPAGASAHVAEAIPGPSKAAPKPSADKAKLKRKISSVMRRIEHAEGLLQEAADAMNAEYNEETVAAYEAANANVEEMYADMQSLEDQLATA